MQASRQNKQTGLNRAITLACLSLTIMAWVLFPMPIPASRAMADKPLPFAPGEKLTFALRWSVIPAGEAVMEVMPMKMMNGMPAYHFRLTAESNSFVDVFYKVRDRIDAYAAADMSHAVHYRKKQREGEHRKNVKVEFDWQNGTAQYSDGDKTKKPIKVSPGTFDPLSVFYFTRTLDFKEKAVLTGSVTDGSKCVEGVARIVKRETITVPSGTYDTYLIEPDLKHVGGVFEKSKDAKIRLWVTADQRRIPVKIASKVVVGSFVGELVSIKTPKKENS